MERIAEQAPARPLEPRPRPPPASLKFRGDERDASVCPIAGADRWLKASCCGVGTEQRSRFLRCRGSMAMWNASVRGWTRQGRRRVRYHVIHASHVFDRQRPPLRPLDIGLIQRHDNMIQVPGGTFCLPTRQAASPSAGSFRLPRPQSIAITDRQTNRSRRCRRARQEHADTTSRRCIQSATSAPVI